MKTSIEWKEGMLFDAKTGTHLISMDAKPPVGKELGVTPKELVAAGLGGCTAMDVISLMNKHKQDVKEFKIEVDVEPTTGGHPITFAKADIHFYLTGAIDAAIALESVRLSQTKYCGVSSMLSKSFPITYHVHVNGELVGKGQADFQ